MAFTLVFPGLIRQYAGNPFDAETPFGKAQVCAIGDQSEMADIYRAALELISEDPRDYLDIARKALREVDDMVTAELDASRSAAKAEAKP